MEQSIQWGGSIRNTFPMKSTDPTVYPTILKLLITRGNITLILREATQEEEKKNFKIQPEKCNRKENKNNIKKENN